jgi:hypothetical protein
MLWPAERSQQLARTAMPQPPEPAAGGRAGSEGARGYCESFNSKLRDELLAGEQFSTLHEAKVLIEQWRHH